MILGHGGRLVEDQKEGSCAFRIRVQPLGVGRFRHFPRGQRQRAQRRVHLRRSEIVAVQY